MIIPSAADRKFSATAGSNASNRSRSFELIALLMGSRDCKETM